MYNIFEQYGIKEVANVYFEALDRDEAAKVYPGDIVLYLDSLKVSTIETSAETADARGGWGNPRLVSWDYGKEITVTLEDALISFESLRFMLGGAIKYPEANDSVLVRRTEEFVCDGNGKLVIPAGITIPAATADYPIRLINLTTGVRTQLTSGTLENGKKVSFKNPDMIGGSAVPTAANDRVRVFWIDQVTTGANAEKTVEITISPNTFPGTYRVVGDTFIRKAGTGADEMFQFVIGAAKVTSNVTLTLQAEGDPATFSMTLNVLRSKNEDAKNEMMKLIRYSTSSESSVSGDDIGSIVS